MEFEYITQGPRMCGRICHEIERYEFLITNDKEIVLVDHNEPTNYQEANVDPNSINWHQAVKSKMQSMYDNQVWNLMD